MKIYVVGFAVTAALAPCRLVLADEGDARVLAESFFREGRRLMDAGQVAEGCRALEASQRLDPASGTLLALATCHEEEGRSATAWSEFNQALSVARRDGRTDRARFAAEHIATLESALPRLAIDVAPESRVPGLVVLRNSAELNEAAWGSALPADPGVVVIEARAPGRVPWTLQARVTPSETVRVSVPALAFDETAKARSPAPSAPDAPSGAAYRPARRTIAIAVAGVAAAAIGVGVYAGVRTLQKRSDSDSECPTVGGELRCTDQGAEDNRDAQTWATVADVTIGIGAVGAIVAGYMWLTAGTPRKRATALGFSEIRLMPTAERRSLGGALTATW